jgi:hypothetical protein
MGQWKTLVWKGEACGGSRTPVAPDLGSPLQPLKIPEGGNIPIAHCGNKWRERTLSKSF